MRIVFLVSVVMLCLTKTAAASEKIYVNTAIFYANETAKYDDSKIDQVRLFYHLGAGLRLGSGLMIGGKYVHYDEDAKNGDTKSSNILTGFGPALGYMHKTGLGMMATYLIEPERQMKSGKDTTTWTGGDGYVVDLGYYFERGDWAIGPQLSIVNATYKKVESSDGSLDLSSPMTQSYMYPFAALFFYF